MYFIEQTFFLFFLIAN